MAQDQVRDFSGGINQSGVRAFNERLLLSILQRSDGLSSGDLARRTGLSPQTTSVILRKLEQDGLLVRGDRVKGKVGKPSQPFTLNPDGAFAVGLKLGRRSPPWGAVLRACLPVRPGRSPRARIRKRK